MLYIVLILAVIFLWFFFGSNNGSTSEYNISIFEQDLEAANPHEQPYQMHLRVNNSYLAGKKLIQISEFLNRDMVCSRLIHDGQIIIPNRKRNIFARLFNPSLAHKMLFLSDTPLLVIPI